jgi:AraC-like DNA-binding protein
MERVTKNMDFGVKHWAPFRRRFPLGMPVTSANFVRKDHWVRTTFGTCNFSLILRGRGIYRWGGKEWEFRAPMVLTQCPGEPVEYGPPPGETWDEVYVIYEAALQQRWKACGILQDGEPLWSIADPAALQPHLLELRALTRAGQPEESVDRVDRVCERLIAETRLPAAAADGLSSAIPSVLARLQREFGSPVDFDAIAAENGMSPSTFRRRWQEALDRPPGRYLQDLRMQEACRQLVETRRPVREIAQSVGFEDELYFSRRFRQERGLAPRDYRKRYSLLRS